jgi:hypothetical protein
MIRLLSLGLVYANVSAAYEPRSPALRLRHDLLSEHREVLHVRLPLLAMLVAKLLEHSGSQVRILGRSADALPLLLIGEIKVR